MPTLDVSQVLDCPEFYDYFDVVWSSSTVGQDGENNENNTGPIRGIRGVIAPASKAVLQRLPDLANLSGVIEVYTRFRLNNGRGPMGADVILYRGASYTVLDIMDFSPFGSGFIHAICSLNEFNPESIPT